MNKTLSSIVVTLALLLILGVTMTSCTQKKEDINMDKNNGLNSTVDIKALKTDIELLIKRVYAPSSADEFNKAKQEYSSKMSKTALIDMFGTKEITKLTERDLERSVINHFVVFGSAEWQSDKQPRMLTAFSVSSKDLVNVIRIDIEFLLEADGSIKSIIISH